MKRSHFKQVNRLNKLKKWSLIAMLCLVGLSCFIVVCMHLRATREAHERFFHKYPIRGFSLNQDDDYMDFNKFKQQGGQFVYLRSSQGEGYLDDDFNDNYDRSIGSGLKIGVYHQYGFATSIQGQENNFSRALNGKIGQLPLRLDIDYYGKYTAQNVDQKQLAKRIHQFVDYLYRRYNRPVLIKTNWSNYQLLKEIPHTQFMLPKGKVGPQVTFTKLKADDPFYQDGKSSSHQMNAYLGNKLQWKRYIQELE